MKQPLQFSLEAANSTIKAGEMPTFRLTIRNVGDSPERIIDLSGGRRPDLQDSYYDLEVTQAGKAVDVPRIISDPGPIIEDDFLELNAGEMVTFELTHFASMFGMLPPGKYQARVRFWQVPYQPGQSFLFSPYADFTVRE